MKNRLMTLLVFALVAVVMVGCGSAKSKAEKFKKKIDAAVEAKDQEEFLKQMEEMGTYFNELSKEQKKQFVEAWGSEKEYFDWIIKISQNFSVGKKMSLPGAGLNAPGVPPMPPGMR